MRAALELAERGRWSTAPNPTVGAVLVQDGKIVAEGWHQVCGQAHAEVNCLRDAREKGVDVSRCTLYVTLEPCNHQGKTPPCTKAILEAGIPHVVVGMPDVNAQAAGGAEWLDKAISSQYQPATRQTRSKQAATAAESSKLSERLDALRKKNQ